MTFKISFFYVTLGLLSSGFAWGDESGCPPAMEQPASAVRTLDHYIKIIEKERIASRRINEMKSLSEYVHAMKNCDIYAISDASINILASYLKDEDDVVRMYAAVALGNMKGRAKFILPKLEDALNDPNSGVPLGGVIFLPDLGSHSTIQMAITKIKSSP